jgi:thioredoxin 1
MPIQKVTDSTYNNFISEKPIVVVHFSAAWNRVDDEMRSIIMAAAKVLDDWVNFGELDVDENQRTAAESRILTVPTILYFQDGKLFEKVAGLAPNKNLKERINSLLR